MSGAWRARRVGRPAPPCLPWAGSRHPQPAGRAAPLPTPRGSGDLGMAPGGNGAGAWRKTKCRWDRHVRRVHSISSLGI